MAKKPIKKHILLRLIVFLIVFYLCNIIIGKIYPVVDGTVQVGSWGLLLGIGVPILSAIYIPQIPSMLKFLKLPLSREKKKKRKIPTGPAPYCPLNSHYWETVDMPEGDFTVIDVETTGLNPQYDDILELGAIRYRGWNETARYQSYICPLGKLNPEAQGRNHITWEDVSSAPLLSEEFPHFLEFIGDDLLLGYNVGYDIKFIQTRTGINISNITFDVLTFARNSIISHNYKLDTLRDRYSLSGPRHTALGDCDSTVQAFFHILKEPTAQTEIKIRQKIKDPIREKYAD